MNRTSELKQIQMTPATHLAVIIQRPMLTGLKTNLGISLMENIYICQPAGSPNQKTAYQTPSYHLILSCIGSDQISNYAPLNL